MVARKSCASGSLQGSSEDLCGILQMFVHRCIRYVTDALCARALDCENSSQQEAAVYINEIQHEGCRRQPSGHVTCSRENHHPAPIANYQGENSSQQEAAVYINEIQHEGCRRQPSGHVTCSRENHHPAPIANYQGENSSQQEAAVYINEIQHEGCRRQPSGHVTCSRENHHPAPIANYQGENSSQQEAAVYINEIQHEGCRRQPSGHVTCSRENHHPAPIANYQAWNDIRRGSNQQTHKGTYSAIATSKTGPNKGIYDSVQLYCNMQQPNSVRTPGHEYTNVLDLAACTPDLHRDHNHSINTAKKRGFMCF
ncbi:uncharacterized protein [Scyliorhinus torazame]|uniref:uncharacterized protein n=1 Tax=Scyliorhinus torazame TaxID=75743 RepID=UPI003B5B62BE